MFSRRMLFGLTFISSLLVAAAVCLAFTLMTKEEALKEVFWSGAEIEKETVELTGETLENITKRLGGSLVYYQEGSESERVAGTTTEDFYFAKKDGERRGVALIDVEPGKWGPVEFIIAMTVDGIVKNVRVLSYVEIRGKPIARLAFMNQYQGKSVNSTLQVGRDIVGISGATISSRCATFAVKKALVIYEEVYLKKKQAG
jgi:Na+-translocating ferredoxin:NAD+ oxidoreductase RnfG subunit